MNSESLTDRNGILTPALLRQLDHCLTYLSIVAPFDRLDLICRDSLSCLTLLTSLSIRLNSFAHNPDDHSAQNSNSGTSTEQQFFIEGAGLGNLSKLRYLDLGPLHVSVQTLPALSGLESLSLHRFDNFDVPFDQVCAICSNLRSLTDNSSGRHIIVDEALNRLPRLESLDVFDGSHITDVSISMLTNLTRLSITTGSTLSDAGISPLVTLRSLVLYCDVFGHITDAGLSHLLQLEELRLEDGSAITDDSISRLTRLTSLSVESGTDNITDLSIALLVNLAYLDLPESENTVTDLGLSHLLKLEALTLGTAEHVTDSSITRLTNLSELTIFQNETITDCGIFPLTRLQYLFLPHNPKISLEGVQHLDLLRECTTEDIFELPPIRATQRSV